MTRNNPPNDQSFLIGPLDTVQEIQIILEVLRKEELLRRLVSPDEVEKFMEDLKNNHLLYGPVDTPLEVEILLRILRRYGLLQGPIDSPEEIRRFINRLRIQGLLPESLVNATLFKYSFFQNTNKNKNDPNPN